MSILKNLKERKAILDMHQHTEEVIDMSITYDEHFQIVSKNIGGDLSHFDQQYGRINVGFPDGQIIMQYVKVPSINIKKHQSREYINQALQQLMQDVTKHQYDESLTLPRWVPPFTLNH